MVTRLIYDGDNKTFVKLYLIDIKQINILLVLCLLNLWKIILKLFWSLQKNTWDGTMKETIFKHYKMYGTHCIGYSVYEDLFKINELNLVDILSEIASSIKAAKIH